MGRISLRISLAVAVLFPTVEVFALSQPAVNHIVYRCTCSGSWACGESAITGTVSSTPGKEFRSITEDFAQNACNTEMLNRIGGNPCSPNGILLTPTYTCTAEQTTASPFPIPTTGGYVATEGPFWGPIARTETGEVKRWQRPQDALAYCKSIGESLPTKEQFETFRSQLGYPGSYDPTAVPDLSGQAFWTSTDSSPDGTDAWIFEGPSGDFISFPKTCGVAVICVGSSTTPRNVSKAAGPEALHFENHHLVDERGMTVYVFDKDTSASSTCYQQCGRIWPPVLAPTGSGPLPAGVSTSPRTDGSQQLVYRGRPVYRYAGDSQPGESKGDGLGGIWHIVLDGSF